MKIDWKHLSSTDAYKSIKAGYIREVTRRWGPHKSEALKYFHQIIGRAQQHAHLTQQTVEVVLTTWETRRQKTKHNSNSFYSQHHMPKARIKDSLQPEGINGGKKYNAQWNRSPISRKHANCEMINRHNKRVSKKIKPRWKPAYKKSKAEHRKWLKTCL